MTYVIPIIVLFIIVYSYKKKVNIYDEFLIGAKEGVGVAFNLVPSVVAMVLAINICQRFLKFLKKQSVTAAMRLELRKLGLLFLLAVWKMQITTTQMFIPHPEGGPPTA